MGKHSHLFLMILALVLSSCGGAAAPINNGAVNLPDTVDGSSGSLDVAAADSLVPSLDSTPDSSGLEPGCCFSLEDCAEGLVCVREVPEQPGRCLEPIESWECRTSRDCGEGTFCLTPESGDYSPITCTSYPRVSGLCVPGSCCGRDGDCGAGELCLIEQDQGTCVPGLQAGQCYRDSDCQEGLSCQGRFVCPCGYDCSIASVPGECVEDQPQPTCCYADQLCPEGQVCRGTGLGGGAGFCLARPEPDRCYEDQDCQAPASCTGFDFGQPPCHCSDDCSLPSIPGWCVLPRTTCCRMSEDCQDGYQCRGSMNEGFLGTCLPAPSGQSCWEDLDCNGGKCLGAILPLDCTEAEAGSPGTCSPPVCGTGPISGSDLGTPCPSGHECEGLDAFMCSTFIPYDLYNLPPICLLPCQLGSDCPPGSSCHFSIASEVWCVPDECATWFSDPDYCVDNSDCGLGINWHQCCPCPQAFTQTRIQSDPCITEGVEFTQPVDPDCQMDCDMACEPCSEVMGSFCSQDQCREALPD